MHRKLLAETVTIFVIFLFISTFLTALPVTKVLAADELDQIVPAVGYVGTEVIVYGNINTLNGSYKIFFDDVEVNKGIEVFECLYIVGSGSSGKIVGIGFDSVKKGCGQPGRGFNATCPQVFGEH